jgi:hypothetical protein
VGIIVERDASGDVTSYRVVDMNVWDKRDSVAAAVTSELFARLSELYRLLVTCSH